LNLEPGDIILGYDGLPWKENLKELLDQELPILFGNLYVPSSIESRDHTYITSAGNNWGLFETIDILKYSTGDTLHYPTSLMSSITQPYFIATEQLPINGVSFPNLNQNTVISWGVIEGTTIGYIYVWDWYTGGVSSLFGQAIDELIHLHNITGLILDYRMNWGGYPSYANAGLNILFNEDFTSYYRNAVRVPGNDHFLFNLFTSGPFINPITPTPELFSHPIAVLLGPNTCSAGDYNTHKMQFHPMSRFFGTKSAGAYTSYSSGATVQFSKYNYKYRIDNGGAYSIYNNEGFLIHKGCPVDDEVWLTRDGVASGQDDVVNRAIEWINNLVYPHDIRADKMYYSVGEDTVHLSTIIENPNSHQLFARAYLSTLEGVVTDSVNFVKQTLNSSGEQWTAEYLLPPTEEIYKVSVTVFDETALDQFTVPNATRFTTAGPVVLDSLTCIKQSNYYRVKTFIKNLSITITIPNALVILKCNDPWLQSIYPNQFNVSGIPPGATVSNTTPFTVRVIDSLFPGYFNFKVDVMLDGWPFWTDSILVIVTGIESEEILPTEYALFQNFPNPFNPSTKISWQSPVGSWQIIKVFDVLGNEIATLVDEYKPAGRYEVEFKAERLASGIYFYQLRAGEYISVKKMILIK